MPQKVNKNAPARLDYAKGLAIGAAYKHSISLKDAARMVKESDIGVAMKERGTKFTSLIKKIIIDKAHKRHKFNSNPWVGNVAADAKEYTIEPQIWRMISFSPDGRASQWFLAKHKGANNGFEFWHIENTAGLKGARGAAKGAAQPAIVFDLVDDHEDNTMELAVPRGATPDPIFPGLGEVDDWEDLL